MELDDNERGVLFRRGRFVGVRGPGRVRTIPGLDQLVVVDLRPRQIEAGAARAWMEVVSPEDAVLRAENYERATAQIIETALNADISRESLEQTINDATATWGVRVWDVEVADR